MLRMILNHFVGKAKSTLQSNVEKSLVGCVVFGMAGCNDNTTLPAKGKLFPKAQGRGFIQDQKLHGPEVFQNNSLFIFHSNRQNALYFIIRKISGD